ncbi:hypothetical protein [Faecalicoccus pleomorphus]|uniref:hypothetical protein n=1 Tax=Faecalicoccus pleomorphus TaxID=1323 RepID=UPI0026EBFD7E|nr:hypothetical protein [Faecalicoccus pleomorphus]
MSDKDKIIWIHLHEKNIRNSFTQIKEKESITIFHSSQSDNVIDIISDYETVKQEYEWYLENNFVKEIDGKYVVLVI